MAQKSSVLMTAEYMDRTDWRTKFVEVNTSPDDFASADCSLILATIPFLPAGDHFVDIPLSLVGLTQNFGWSEGASGQMVPEVGSDRKINVTGTSMGSGSIARLHLHGNSLLTALYRPTLQWLKESKTLHDINTRTIAPIAAPGWINALLSSNVDIYSSNDLSEYLDKVVATGGMGSPLFKMPFGLIDVKRDARQRVLSINFLEQCSLRGNQSGLSAGQFQLQESISFEFERVRPLMSAGPFSLSDSTIVGI